MTFQYFIGAIIFAFAMNLFVVAALDGVLAMFYRPVGGRYLRVVVKNDGLNF